MRQATEAAPIVAPLKYEHESDGRVAEEATATRLCQDRVARQLPLPDLANLSARNVKFAKSAPTGYADTASKI
jgi:hypothetical protein